MTISSSLPSTINLHFLSLVIYSLLNYAPSLLIIVSIAVFKYHWKPQPTELHCEIHHFSDPTAKVRKKPDLT